MVCALLALACTTKERGAPSEAADTRAAEPSPVAPRITDQSERLVFSYLDPETKTHRTASNIEGIPEEAREQVIVTDLSRTPKERQSDRFIMIADLRKKSEDGTYPVRIASRFASDRTDGGDAKAPDSEAPVRAVTLYTASWCGVCRKTKRLLESWKVPYTEKDIELSKSARDELAAKAATAGLSTESMGVPVIDVAGKLLVGLHEQALKEALEAAGLP
jgi:glutaredoxin